MKKYSLEIKLNAIQDYLKGMESFEDTAKRHNVTTTKL
jgi:transposase-like protein